MDASGAVKAAGGNKSSNRWNKQTIIMNKLMVKMIPTLWGPKSLIWWDLHISRHVFRLRRFLRIPIVRWRNKLDGLSYRVLPWVVCTCSKYPEMRSYPVKLDRLAKDGCTILQVLITYFVLAWHDKTKTVAMARMSKRRLEASDNLPDVGWQVHWTICCLFAAGHRTSWRHGRWKVRAPVVVSQQAVWCVYYILVYVVYI